MIISYALLLQEIHEYIIIVVSFPMMVSWRYEKCSLTLWTLNRVSELYYCGCAIKRGSQWLPRSHWSLHSPSSQAGRLIFTHDLKLFITKNFTLYIYFFSLFFKYKFISILVVIIIILFDKFFPSDDKVYINFSFHFDICIW